MLKKWKQYVRRMTSFLLTTTITITTAGAYPAQTFAAYEKGIYVSEVIAYQGSLEDAKAKNPDYIFVEDDISQGGGSGKATFLGYKTTDDASLALRDIATLPMNGNYSITDYGMLMEDKKDVIKECVYAMQVAAGEYKENYKAGKKRAKHAYKLLNKYYEEDTGLKMGDFFLAEEPEVTYENYETLVLQSNSTTLNALKKILLTAADTKENTWVDRFAEIKNFGNLVKRENEKRKAKGESEMSQKAAKAYYAKLFQNRINYFKEGWELLWTGLNHYLEVGISIHDEEAFDYMEENAEQEEGLSSDEYAVYGAIYETLDKIPFDEGSMVDVFLQPFDSVDEDQMYVLMDSMSEAQLELGPDVGLTQMFLMTAEQAVETGDEESVMPVVEESREEIEAGMEEQQELIVSSVDTMIEEIEDIPVLNNKMMKKHAISVYAGVDRDFFFGGTIGMTAAGAKEQLSTNNSWYDSSAVFVAACVAGTIGIGLVGIGIYQLWTGYKIMNADNIMEIEFVLEISTEALKELNQQLKISKRVIKNSNEPSFVRYWNGVIDDVNKKIALCQQRVPSQAEQELLAQAQSSAKAANILGAALLVVGIALTAISLVEGITYLQNQKEPEYMEIPEKMIDTSKGDEVTQPFLYYNVVRDQDGNAADLNNYTSGTWLALYTTRSYDAGLPILAEDFANIRRGDIGTDTLNMGFAHEFGAQDPENLLGYSKNAQDVDATYLLFNHGEAPLSGSTFGGNDMMGFVILAGLAIAGGAVLFFFRKKEESVA